MVAPTDTMRVIVLVLGIARVDAGRLAALADVALDFDGIELVLHGVRIVRSPAGQLGIEAPCFRHDGLARAAVSLPPELRAAIADQVLAEYRRAARCGRAGGL